MHVLIKHTVLKNLILGKDVQHWFHCIHFFPVNIMVTKAEAKKQKKNVWNKMGAKKDRF